jgi:hypothetical protein
MLLMLPLPTVYRGPALHLNPWLVASFKFAPPSPSHATPGRFLVALGVDPPVNYVLTLLTASHCV